MPGAPDPSPANRTRTRPRLLEPSLGRLVGRRIFAVVKLTFKAAFRYRLLQVLLVLLLGAVCGLPVIVKHDGTASGFTQILLTYTLGSVTVLLGFATLWLGCGTLSRDVEECQMQVVAVKPIQRWEIWIGKWLGILVLNALLLGVAGATIFLLVQWRAAQLPADLQTELGEKIFVARGAARPNIDQAFIARRAEEILQELLKNPAAAAMEAHAVRTQAVQRAKASLEIVPPGAARRWTVDLGPVAAIARNQPLTVRTKFFAADGSTSGTFYGAWLIGPAEGRRYVTPEMSLAPETFHEFPIPAGLVDDQGSLTIDFLNPNNTALLFTIQDGVEVLYPEGSFGLNFARALAIIFCWLALLAAIGLAAGSFLSFPVAAFCAIGVLLVGSSTTTLRQVVDEGGISPVNANTGKIEEPLILDHVAVPMAKGLLWTINLVRGFSPVDALSTGRSVSWATLAVAFSQIVCLMGGLFATLGITLFTRRELATAQGP